MAAHASAACYRQVNTILFCEYPLGCACGAKATDPKSCSNPTQFTLTGDGTTACDPLAPTNDASCSSRICSLFECRSYDPPTTCRCYNGIAPPPQ